MSKQGVKITLIVEGDTEKAFLPHLRAFLAKKLENSMPNITPYSCDGGVYTEEKLKRTVETLLSGKKPADHVIALTDVYTGDKRYKDAADAKAKMRSWVGKDNARFHPHAAQYDFEAWLLPYWDTIQKLAKHNKKAPPGNPESVNHDKSPAYHIKEIFALGKVRAYVKPREAKLILEKNGLEEAIRQCPELKALVNTILTVCGADPI